MNGKVLFIVLLMLVCFGMRASEPCRNNDGIKHLWNADMTQFRYPNWQGELYMSSSRQVDKNKERADSGSYYPPCGALYTYGDGSEYESISSIRDWLSIPGVTGYQANKLEACDRTYLNNSSFVGNVNDGKTGISAMQVNQDGIRASKMWIITDRFILCLGAGISSDRDAEVITTIDRRLLKENLKYLKNYRWVKTVSNDFGDVPDIRFFQDKTGYIIFKPQKGRAVVQQNPDQQQVFSLWLSHGQKPSNESYEYLILPATTQREVKNFDVSQIRVLSNTPRIQSVNIDNVTYVAAYPLVDIDAIEGVHFQSSNTGLFMIEEQSDRYKVTVVDPTLLQTQIEISLKGQKQIVELPKDDEKGTPVIVYFNK